MLQRLLDGHLRIASSGQVAERSARRGQHDTPYIFAPARVKAGRSRCVGVDGKTVAPLAPRPQNNAPAQTKHSLFASATVAPRSAAASVGARLAAPVIAAITHSAGRCAASTIACGPLLLRCVSRKPGLEFAVSAGSATTAKRAPSSRASVPAHRLTVW